MSTFEIILVKALIFIAFITAGQTKKIPIFVLTLGLGSLLLMEETAAPYVLNFHEYASVALKVVVGTTLFAAGSFTRVDYEQDEDSPKTLWALLLTGFLILFFPLWP